MLAKSDGANMLRLNLLEAMLGRLVKIRKTILDIDSTNQV
jgi:3-deoxy-D-manno-octulosonic acid (KDO) 8-phosphate synthase